MENIWWMGLEDGLDGKSRAIEYFVPGTEAYKVYREGFLEGLRIGGY